MPQPDEHLSMWLGPNDLRNTGASGGLRLRRKDPMTRSSTSADAPKPQRFGVSRISWRPNKTALWMGVTFVVAVASAAIVIGIFGTGDRGIGLALRVTARWSFLLFWLAYTGSAMATLWGPRFGGLARRGREFGLGFASAQLVHVALVLGAGAGGGMIFFWVGILCTYLLALLSLPRLREALEPRLWRTILAIGLNYIALVFAADFIVLPLQTGGLAKYPLSYLPFALMLVGGAGLRIAAFLQRRPRRLRQTKTT